MIAKRLHDKKSWLLLLCSLLFFSFVLLQNSFAAESTSSQSPAARVIDKPFYQAVESSHQLADRLQEQLAGLQHLPREMLHIWQKVGAGHSSIYPFILLAQIGLVILAGAFLEKFFRNRLQPVYDSLCSSSPDWFVYKLLHIGLRVLLEALFLLVFILLTFSLYVLIFPEKGIAASIASNYLLAAYYIKILFFLVTVFLSPRRATLRILPFSDHAAKFLFIWSVSICSAEILLARSGVIMRKAGADQGVVLAMTGLIVISTTLMLIIMIMRSRQRVADTLCPASEKQTNPSLTCQLADNWHVLALSLLFFITTMWEIRVLDSGKIHFGKIIVGLLAIPIFFSLDVWGRRLLQLVLKQSDIGENEPGSLLEKVGIGNYIPHILFTYRLLLMTLLIFFFLGLFRIDVAIGRMFTAGVLTSVFIIILIYLAWQFFTGWVDKKIRAEMPDEEEMDEGGKGGSRRGTLLLLLRKFVLVILVVIASMSILSALGLNIAPLIAGAGILGLAISFGAQSLVTDIFAGIFFLIDDAFRVGDYIDTGSAKGLVEHISLRAVRLRHHRGMVQTVPFGKIGTVVNFSRDYIIMKLDFRVKYDTDVDKVRKIVKRIYKELLADEELGPRLIGKLKSQGVRQMDDSAMIMRIKFTTPPGEQFIMRKEILWRLKEAFKKNNIDFAHRNVTVYMPNEHETAPQQSPADQRIQGAATAALLAEEQRAAKINKPDNM
ncbi:MAG: mechanosensitive ion channel family protein [Thermodesulfobacteriota bacterium]